MGKNIDIYFSCQEQGDDMSQKLCQVCALPFQDDEPLVAVVLSCFHDIPSTKSFSISRPTECLEIYHVGCYEGNDPEDRPHIEVN